MYTARIHFLADRADDFLPDGQIVTQVDFDDVQEIVEYVQEFADAIESSLVFCHENGRTVDLSDFANK